MVPHFTGRQKECEEIHGHVTSGSTRIVSIWGSPGFGKTSVAIAVGHHLLLQGVSVYYLSLRGLQSKADVASKLLSLFRRPVQSDQPNQQRLSIDDELCYLLSGVSDYFTIILDNADDLLSGGPKMKEDFTHFLAEILRRAERVKFVITTRESLEYLNVQFQGHQAVRINPLDEPSSQSLVNKLLPKATAIDCKRVTQICGHVPLAMKLLSSSISEAVNIVEPTHVLDDFMGSLQNHNVVEMLDNPDFPTNLRLKLLFDSSFQRLSSQEKEALVSLCVLPESFDLTIAAAVLGVSQTPLANRVLHNLRRKSLLESSSKPGSFSMHPLIRSFANDIGEKEMKESIVKSKARQRAFFICRFKELNEQFLTGYSMSAFIEFYQDEQNIKQSLIEGCSDSKTANSVFEVLVKAELFLCSLYFREESNFNTIYDSALRTAKMLNENVLHRQLLVSKALYKVTWGARGKTMKMLSKAKDIEASYPCSPVSVADKGKHLCYSGISQLVNGQTETGVQCLEEAISLMSGTPEQAILRIIAFQILATYYGIKNNSERMSHFYDKSLQDCEATGNTELLIIPTMEGRGKKFHEKEMTQQPLRFEIICLVSEAGKRLKNTDTVRSIGDAAQQIAKDFGKSSVNSSLGLFIFQRNVNITLQHMLKNVEGVHKMSMERITSFHEKALTQRRKSLEPDETIPSVTTSKGIVGPPRSRSEQPYRDPSVISSPFLSEDFLPSLQSAQRIRDGRHELYDFFLIPPCRQRALDNRLELFEEEHPSTADDDRHSLQITQYAVDSKKEARSSTSKTKQKCCICC